MQSMVKIIAAIIQCNNRENAVNWLCVVEIVSLLSVHPPA
jgi:hypothetical protein